MANSIPTSKGPIHWILDWDGTLTTRDTLDALVSIAADCKPNSSVSEDWKRVTDAYLSDHNATLGHYIPDGKLPVTIAGEKALLGAVEEVEQRSIDRVSASGIFEGLITMQLDEGAAKAVESKQVELRKGCADFLHYVRSRTERPDGKGDAMNILSVNWSRRFMVGCLKASRMDSVPSTLGSIYANELEGLEEGKRSTGRIGAEGTRRIISSRDKLACLKSIREKALHPGAPVPVVYIGDSWTDFECLLDAELGICIRDEPMTSTQKKLADAIARMGIRCPRLCGMKQADEWRVVWAKDFHEIYEWFRE